MLNPKYYPRLTLAKAIKEDLLHKGEIVLIHDIRMHIIYHGTIDRAPKKVLGEYVLYIEDRLAASGCKLNDKPMDCIRVCMLCIKTPLSRFSAKGLMKLYDRYRDKDFVGKTLRNEIVRRMENM